MRVWALLFFAVPAFARGPLLVSPANVGDGFLPREVAALAPRLRIRVTIDDRAFYRGHGNSLFEDLSGTTVWLLPDSPSALPISLPVLSAGRRYTPSVEAYVPEDVPLGKATLSMVSRGGTSLSTTIEVRPAQPRLLAVHPQDSLYGPAIARRGIGGELIGLAAPARPGDWVTLEAIGLGLTTAERVRVRLAGTSLPVSVIANPQAPGIDWVSFRVPEAGVPDGCFLVLEIEAAGRRSRGMTLPKESGSGPCRHPFGFTMDQLMALDRGEQVDVAAVSYYNSVQPSETVPGQMVRRETLYFIAHSQGAGDLALAARYSLSREEASWAGCRINRYDAEIFATRLVDPLEGRYLDAGPALTVQWDGSTAMLSKHYTTYTLRPSIGPVPDVLASAPPLLPPGPVRLQSAGGRDVAAFDLEFDIPAPPVPLGWDGLNAVERGRGLRLRWDPRSYTVDDHISVSVGVIRSPYSSSSSVTCESPAAAGEMLVPASLLTTLPSTGGEPEGFLSVDLSRSSAETGVFTVPLVRGGFIKGQATYSSSLWRHVVVE